VKLRVSGSAITGEYNLDGYEVTPIPGKLFTSDDLMVLVRDADGEILRVGVVTPRLGRGYPYDVHTEDIRWLAGTL
jgi:hypothetical protein